MRERTTPRALPPTVPPGAAELGPPPAARRAPVGAAPPLLVAAAAPAAVAFLSTAEAELGRLIMEHPEQRRAHPTPHPILAQVARARADDMAQRGFFDHVTPEGFGANHFIREADYPLAAIFSTEPAANNVESIAKFTPTPKATATLLLNSPPHREHLLGLRDFYAAENDYGIGHAIAPSNPARDVWVILTAFPEP